MITRPTLIFLGLALVLCLGLGACVQEEPPAPPAPPEPAKPVAAAPAPKPVEPQPKPPRRGVSAPTGKPAKTPPPTADELVGLDEGGVRKLLGAPAETRTDGAARILAYRSAACALEVFLFMDLRAGDLRVVSYQWEEAAGSRAPAAKTCYGEFRVPQ